MKTIPLLALLLAATDLVAPRFARAADRFFFPSGSSGDWDTQANWKDGCSSGAGNGQIPSASDDVSICANKTAQVTATDAVCRTLFVSSGAGVQIIPQSSSHATLMVGNTTSSPPLEDHIFGSVTLGTPNQGHHATLAFVAASHFVYGGEQPPFMLGEIKGQDDGAAVTIDSGNTVTSYLLLIHGNLQIAGAGSFTNEGTVQADANGTLAVEIDGYIDDTSGSSPACAVWNNTSRFFGGEAGWNRVGDSARRSAAHHAPCSEDLPS